MDPISTAMFLLNLKPLSPINYLIKIPTSPISHIKFYSFFCQLSTKFPLLYTYFQSLYTTLNFPPQHLVVYFIPQGFTPKLLPLKIKSSLAVLQRNKEFARELFARPRCCKAKNATLPRDVPLTLQLLLIVPNFPVYYIHQLLKSHLLLFHRLEYAFP